MKNLAILFFIILLCCLMSCKKESENQPTSPNSPRTFSVTVTNNLGQYHYGNIEVTLDGKRFPTITPGASRTVTGISEGIHSISASGVGFINISANIPVYENFHACLEGGQVFGQFPFWVACP